jgi:hypothetical protein
VLDKKLDPCNKRIPDVSKRDFSLNIFRDGDSKLAPDQ